MSCRPLALSSPGDREGCFFLACLSKNEETFPEAPLRPPLAGPGNGALVTSLASSGVTESSGHGVDIRTKSGCASEEEEEGTSGQYPAMSHAVFTNLRGKAKGEKGA